MTDTFPDDVALLLHMDGTDGSGVFTDSSPNALIVTAVNSATITTTNPKFGTGALNCVSNQYLSIPMQPALQPTGTKKLTIEGWFTCADHTDAVERIIISCRDPVAGGYTVSFNASLQRIYFTMWSVGGQVSVSTGVIVDNAWHHFAAVVCPSVTNTLGLFKLASDGAFSATVNITAPPAPITQQLTIGADYLSAGALTHWHGLIDEVRITSQGVRYGQDFTPPTVAFTDPSAPVCDPYSASVITILHMVGSGGSNTFTDSSSQGLTFTPHSGAVITTSTPKFIPASMDCGSNGYISTPFIAGSALDLYTGNPDWTIEGFYRPIVSANQNIFGMGTGSSNGLVLTHSSAADTLTVSFEGGGGPTSGATSKAVINAWNHFAVTRAGGFTYVFLNGVSNTTRSSVLPTTAMFGELDIGQYASVNFTGLITEFRITRGFARYIRDFTPPQYMASDTPCVACDNTYTSNTLLLHMDGANTGTSFTDSSPTNATITAVGAAQTATANPNLGTATGKFTDTAQSFAAHLTTPLSVASPLDISTGDFTIEAWLFASTNTIPSGNAMVLDYTNSFTTGFQVYAQNPLQVVLQPSNANLPANINSGVLLDLTRWTHFAVSRNSNIVRLFVDGMCIGVASSTTVIGSGNIGAGGFSGTLYIAASFIDAVQQTRWPGQIDDFRITKGLGRYPQNFKPVRVAFANLVCPAPPPPPTTGGSVYGKFIDSGRVFKPVQSANLGNAKPRVWQPSENMTIKVPK